MNTHIHQVNCNYVRSLHRVDLHAGPSQRICAFRPSCTRCEPGPVTLGEREGEREGVIIKGEREREGKRVIVKNERKRCGKGVVIKGEGNEVIRE